MHAISCAKRVEEKTRRILSEIFAGCPVENVGVRLWDDSIWPNDRPSSATLVLKHPGALARMFLPGTEAGLAEAYLRGGVANYMGTYWPVNDAAAMAFAEEFYTNVINGISLGQSLLLSRQKVEALGSVDWADYIHIRGVQDS